MSNRLLTVLLVLVVAVLALMAYQNMEWQEEWVNHGWSDAADRNPYLAAELFLEQRQIEVTTASVFGEDLALMEHDVLFVPDSQKLRLDGQRQWVLDCVAAGGHLILGIQWDEGEFGYLFGQWPGWALDDDWYENEFEEDMDFGEFVLKENEELVNQFKPMEEGEVRCLATYTKCYNHRQPDIGLDQLTEMMFFTGPGLLQIHFQNQHIINLSDYDSDPDPKALMELTGLGLKAHSSSYLTQGGRSIEPDVTPLYAAGNTYGAHFSQVSYGRGLVSMAGTFEFWESQEFSHFDHAYFLELLTQGAESALFVLNVEVPTLRELVLTHFPEALVVFLFCVLVTILHYGRRFGPVFQRVDNPRRSRGEHLLALGKYRWRTNDRSGLVDHLRKDIFYKANRRWPGFDKFQRKRQVELVSKASEIPVETIFSVLFDQITLDEFGFTQLVSKLQKIRQKL